MPELLRGYYGIRNTLHVLRMPRICDRFGRV